MCILGGMGVSEEIGKQHLRPFQKLRGFHEVFKVNLREGGTLLCLNIPLRLPIGLSPETKYELVQMQKLGVIKKVRHPKTWCSGMVVAPKSNGKVRICVNLSQLNKRVQRETYPLSHLGDNLASLEGSRYFSKMDTNSGFSRLSWRRSQEDIHHF